MTVTFSIYEIEKVGTIRADSRDRRRFPSSISERQVRRGGGREGE